ncbi:DMT(drug/metabolite transporter) superfamily permease [Desulfosporosinus orientis DSM 765]|uniref:DMT(Drug/metabolite transporter) superfamily permease n=1 Tax=Desulfosporosinus orientis (strain ATCC 19365 / DSM 765 / NCIMB 8382 / VKM B-1628 / Singapore I) TaxID=768706 RepID=G7WIK6_DESOD|nr:DMT family transporter [Desulfosporosinus orientis]AET69080.1 DMT(drug/metabolite transporter) superfamily permease [Desulfosporosinus orientis DSM 765]
MSDKQVRLLMVLTSVLWSGAFITGKFSIQEFPPFALTFFRFFFALPFIFTILVMQKPKRLLPRGKQWPALLLLGFIGTFCYHAFFFTSLGYTTAINSSLIGALNPMVTTLLAALFFSERLSFPRILGIFLSFSGVFLFITNGDLHLITQFQVNHGDFLMMLGVLCFSIYSLLSRRYMKQYDLTPFMITAYTFLICVVISLPFALWENPATYLYTATMKGWLSILYMSVFASVLGYLFQSIAIEHIGAPQTAVFINLVPIFTIVQSVLILHESITIIKLFCAAVVVSGVYLATRPETKVYSAGAHKLAG